MLNKVWKRFEITVPGVQKMPRVSSQCTDLNDLGISKALPVCQKRRCHTAVNLLEWHGIRGMDRPHRIDHDIHLRQGGPFCGQGIQFDPNSSIVVLGRRVAARGDEDAIGGKLGKCLADGGAELSARPQKQDSWVGQ